MNGQGNHILKFYQTKIEEWISLPYLIYQGIGMPYPEFPLGELKSYPFSIIILCPLTALNFIRKFVLMQMYK